MKLAYPVAESGYTGKVKGLKGAYDANFAWLKAHGYTGVELLIQNPETVDIKELDAALERYDLQIAAIGTSLMQIQEKLYLIHADKENREEARRRWHGLLGLCEKYHAPVLVGKYRGMVSSEPGCSFEALSALMCELCEEAEQKKIPVLIEPQNADNINNLNTIDEMTD